MVKVLDASAPAGAKEEADDDRVAKLFFEMDILTVLILEAESAKQRVRVGV
jgi:hypothetical protein